MPEPTRRIDYAGSVHGQREIDAVVDVLRSDPTALARQPPLLRV